MNASVVGDTSGYDATLEIASVEYNLIGNDGKEDRNNVVEGSCKENPG
jgi:hypothetical protein